MQVRRPRRPRGSARARPPAAGGWSPRSLTADVCRLILLRLVVELGRTVYEYFVFRWLTALARGYRT